MSFGVPFAKGVVQKGQTFSLATAAGQAMPAPVQFSAMSQPPGMAGRQTVLAGRKVL